MTVSDERGTLHYTEKDGEKFLRATNPSGKLIFEGPVNTEQERQGLPGDLRSRLRIWKPNRKKIGNFGFRLVT